MRTQKRLPFQTEHLPGVGCGCVGPEVAVIACRIAVANSFQLSGYDRYGNLTSFTQNIGGNPASSNPSIDANTNRFNANQGFTFDKNGNIITDVSTDNFTRNFVFNGDNKQTEVKKDGVTVGRYFYDGEGKRVKKISDLETTIFVYSSGKLVAEYSTATPPASPSVNYTTTDHLGTPRIITDQFGQVQSRRDFLPFGEELTINVGSRSTALKYGVTDDKVRQKFTGYQKDTETSLDFAEARMYDNRFGRFTAVDPLLASAKLSLPSTWNRYVYCLNNPLNCIDPTGMDPVIWAYRSGNGGTYVQHFKSRAEMDEANKVFDTELCRTNDCGQSWQVWTKGNFFLWDDKTATQLKSDGSRQEFSLKQLDDKIWYEMVEQFRGNGINSFYSDFLTEQATSQASRDWQDIQLGLKQNPNLLEMGPKPLSPVLGARQMGTAARRFFVGPANETIKFTAGNDLTVHHVGQATLMERFIPGYNRKTGPSILVHFRGHTEREFPDVPVLKRGLSGFRNARDVLARDIWELRRVYPDVPNANLRQLIELNRTTYPDAFTKLPKR